MKIKIKDLGIICFLLPACFTFIIENMISNGSKTSYIISTSLMMLSLLFATLVLTDGMRRIIRYSWVWSLYIAAVVISLLRRSFATSAVCDVMIILLTLLGVLSISQSLSRLKVGIKFLYIIGWINTSFILLQYIFGKSFNDIYWSLLTPTWKEYAKHYYDKSYYTGLQAVPGQAAGAILFAMGIIACYILVAKCEKKRVRHQGRCYLVLAAMFISLLLTGKKGIFICGIMAFFIMTITIFLQKKQWIRAVLLLIALVVGYNAFKWYVLTHSNVAFLYRFYQFFQNMEAENEFGITTGRNYLYIYAIELWNKHKLLGSGWRTFRDYTVYLYGYETKHDVNLDYLQFLCECGIIGFILIIIPVLTTLFRSLKLTRNILKAKIDYTTKFTIVFSGFIQFFILLYAFFEIPFYDRTFFGVYAFSCIIINNAYREYGRIGTAAYGN